MKLFLMGETIRMLEVIYVSKICHIDDIVVFERGRQVRE